MAIRLIASVYKWSPTELYKMNLKEIIFWFDAAKEVIKGEY